MSDSVMPWTILTRLFSRWNFPGKNTGVDCHFLPPRDQIHVSCISCIGRQILYHCTTWEAQFLQFSSVQFSSVAQSCPTLRDPMNCSMPCFLVQHQLPEFTQTHVHWVGDAIQPSHPLSSPSPSTFNLFQHQGLFKWVSSSHQVARVLEFWLQCQSFRVFRIDFL